MEYNRELLKGNIQTILLAVLANAPRHGYAIAREIARRSDDALTFGEGTIYPALRVLESDGLIMGTWETPEAGPARKVYHITELGRGEFAKRKQTWNAFARTIDRVIEGDADVQPV